MNQITPKKLRLGARGSLLSRLQSALVARSLERLHPGLVVEIITVTTTGDQIQDRPLHQFGGKGLFTKELELALLKKEIDFVVHSFKDVPVTMPLVDNAELLIAATPLREDPRDVLVCTTAKSLLELRPGSRVGTGSLRRQAQILAARPDLVLLPIRGNVDTRLRKLAAGEFDAVILALAGLKRPALFDESLMTPIPEDLMLPAAGQGALALQCRQDASAVREMLAPLNDPHTALAVQLERSVVQQLNGDCHSPIAAYATIINTTITLRTAVAARDGKPPVSHATATADILQPAPAANAVVASLKQQGAVALLT